MADGPDILVRTAPALSATTDEPLAAVPEPPASASNSVVDQENGIAPEMSGPEQAAARGAKTDGTTPAPETTEPKSESDETPAWQKREITKARNAQRAAEQARDQAMADAESARKALEALALKTAEPAPVDIAPDPRPRREAFENPDEYDTALETWAAREGERKATAELTARAEAERAEAARVAEEARVTAEQASTAAEIERLNTAWTEKKTAAMEKYADYAEVAENDALPISVPMAHAVLQAPNGPDIAYYLGKNPAEAARIAAIGNPGLQIFEMGMLAAKIGTPRARPSNAPAPISPLGGTSSPADTSAREPSMAEYGARRTAELRNGRKPFVSGAAH